MNYLVKTFQVVNIETDEVKEVQALGPKDALLLVQPWNIVTKCQGWLYCGCYKVEAPKGYRF